VTALADFEHCPMLYRWRYELGIPSRPAGPPPRRAAGDSPVTAAIDPAEMGTLLHRCMEILDFDRPQPADAIVRAAAEELQLPSDISREAVAREFQPMLDGFLRHPLGRQLAAAGGRLTELEFLLQEGPVRLSGKIDLLWRDAGGAWHILDYKSDHAEGKDLADYARRYELQMTAYALAASRYLADEGHGHPQVTGRRGCAVQQPCGSPLPPNTSPRDVAPMSIVLPAVADATLYFLRMGEARTMRIEPGKLEEAAKGLAGAASRLIAARRTGDFPRCRTAGCRHCAYARYCEAVAGSAE
jgi:RecB family exonuclease